MRTQIEAGKKERADLIQKTRVIFDRAQSEGRAPNTEELSEIDKLHAAAAAKKTETDQWEKVWKDQQEAENDLGRSSGRRAGLQLGDRTNPNGPLVLDLGRDRRGRPRTATFANGSDSYRRSDAEYRSHFSDYLRTGQGGPMAVNQTDIAASGGYLAPPQFNADLIRDLDNATWVRQMARVMMTDAPEFSTPYRSARVSSAVRGAELGAPTADTSLKFGLRKLSPKYIAGQVNISRDLRRSSVIDIDSLVRDEITFEVAALEETEFMIGSGVGLQALGVFVASNDGIPTSRDVAFDSATEFDADTLRDCKYNLKAQYRSSPSISWTFHRDGIKRLSKLKDGEGQYLWQAGITAGDPDTLLGHAVNESEYAPNTYTTGAYAGLLGDWNYFWIVDGLSLEIQVLIETGAGNNQDQIIYRRKMDAAPVQPLAFSRLKMG